MIVSSQEMHVTVRPRNGPDASRGSTIEASVPAGLLTKLSKARVRMSRRGAADRARSAFAQKAPRGGCLSSS